MGIIYFFQGMKTEFEKDEEDIFVEESADNVVEETHSVPEISNIEVNEEERPRGKVKTETLNSKLSIWTFLFPKCCV